MSHTFSLFEVVCYVTLVCVMQYSDELVKCLRASLGQYTNQPSYLLHLGLDFLQTVDLESRAFSSTGSKAASVTCLLGLKK